MQFPIVDLHLLLPHIDWIPLLCTVHPERYSPTRNWSITLITRGIRMIDTDSQSSQSPSSGIYENTRALFSPFLTAVALWGRRRRRRPWKECNIIIFYLKHSKLLLWVTGRDQLIRYKSPARIGQPYQLVGCNWSASAYRMEMVMWSKVSLLGWITTAILCSASGQNVTGRTDPVSLGNGTNVLGVKYPNYDAFYGIPFAQPPVGDLRFAVSRENGGWWLWVWSRALYCWYVYLIVCERWFKLNIFVIKC